MKRARADAQGGEEELDESATKVVVPPLAATASSLMPPPPTAAAGSSLVPPPAKRPRTASSVLHEPPAPTPGDLALAMLVDEAALEHGYHFPFYHQQVDPIKARRPFLDGMAARHMRALVTRRHRLSTPIVPLAWELEVVPVDERAKPLTYGDIGSFIDRLRAKGLVVTGWLILGAAGLAEGATFCVRLPNTAPARLSPAAGGPTTATPTKTDGPLSSRGSQ